MPRLRRARRCLKVMLGNWRWFGWEAQSGLPLTKELRMDMARFEIPVSGCTCLRTVDDASVMDQK